MDRFLTTALRAAEAAAAVHLAHFGTVAVDSAREKAQSDFVTSVDLEAQAAAMAAIRSEFPHHRILAEEEQGGMTGWPEASASESNEGQALPSGEPPEGWRTRRSWPEGGGFLWIVDPLDGTTNFLHGHPMFASSVGVGRARRGRDQEAGNRGLAFDGILEAAAVVAPRTGERWWASRGGGAWKNGLRIEVSGIRELAKALVGTGFPFKEPELVPRHVGQIQRILPASGGVRRGGSAALDLCYLAEGILDAFWEEDYLSPWDTAAGLLILSEAGGGASRLDGTPIDLENGSILAGNSPDLLAGLGTLLKDKG